MEYSGAGGKLIHEKSQKQKILWHCPFKWNLAENAGDCRLPHTRYFEKTTLWRYPRSLTLTWLRNLCELKGTVSRDLLLQVANLPPVSMTRWQIAAGINDTGGKLPLVSTTLVVNFPPVSTTPVAKLPLVSTTPVANLPLVSTMGTISGCRHLKVNLKAKIYIYVSSTTQRWPNKIIKIIKIQIFSICHRCRWHRWQTLSCDYLREFSKKFQTVLME